MLRNQRAGTILIASIGLALVRIMSVASPMRASSCIGSKPSNPVVAHGSDEAMTALEAQADRLAGLITDINLGSKTTGWDIAKRARELRPDLPIVYTSGYAADDWPVQGVPHSLIVRKPFAPVQVVTAISTLMNKASSQPSPGA